MTTLLASTTAAACTTPPLIVALRACRPRSRFGSLLTLLLLLLALAVPLLHWGQHAPQPQPSSASPEPIGSAGVVRRPAELTRLAALYANATLAQQQQQNQPKPQQVNSAAASELSIVVPVSAAASAARAELSSGSAGEVDRLGISKTAFRRLVVLFWTTFWGSSFEQLLRKWGLPPSARCSRLCELAYDKQRSRDADVVLFHAADIESQQLPDAPRADQLWVLFSIEPPTLGYVSSAHDGLFNLTMTYRSDSDIQVGYGHTEAIIAAATDNRSSPTAPPLPPSIAAAADFARRKPYAYWIASNCADPRMAYVRELAKHIRVDVFGKCAPPQARPCHSSSSAEPDWGCVEELSATYAFYLAFENSLCTDYITEKLWRTLVSSGGAIPVVIGAPPSRYEQVAPPGSFVHAESFASPRDLAAHLMRIASSHDLFVSHHLWRTSYIAHLGWYNEFALGVCRLCESTHDGLWRLPRPAKVDLFSWFSAGCRSQWPLGRRK